MLEAQNLMRNVKNFKDFQFRSAHDLHNAVNGNLIHTTKFEQSHVCWKENL